MDRRPPLRQPAAEPAGCEAIAPLPAGRHKVVLATAIAETSLTIEQIRVVVDSGLQRAPRFDPGSGMTRLVTLPVSQASADQRRGRAGRLGPGICYRLWHEAAQETLAPQPAGNPRRRSGRAGPGTGGLGHLTTDALGWLDQPPQRHSPSPASCSLNLGALDEGGKITAHGRHMADLPLHPRLAHMLLAAGKKRWENGLRHCRHFKRTGSPPFHAGRQRDADLRLRLDALQACKAKQQFRIHGCRVDLSAVRHILKVSAMLQQRLGINRKTDAAPEPGRLLAWAYPDRIARQRPGSPGRFLLASGRGAFFASPEPLSASQYLVAAHLDGDRREARIFMAAAIEKERLLDQFAHRIRWQESVSWDSRRKAVSAVRQRVLGALTLDTAIVADPAPEAVLAAMIAGIRETGIASLPWTRGLRTWQARVMLLRRIEADGGPWPDTSDPALAETLEVWLAPYLSGMKRLSDLGTSRFIQRLRNLLSWQQRRQLEALAPTHIAVPSGSGVCPRLQRTGSGAGSPHSGNVRCHRHPGYRQRPDARHAAPAFAGRAPRPDYPGPCRFLAQQLPRGQKRTQRPLPQAHMAG
jgi:ATP-dependent helicase HrpB